MVRSSLALFAGLVLLIAQPQSAQQRGSDAAAVLKAAGTAMGAGNLKTIEFSGNGWDGCLGLRDHCEGSRDCGALYIHSVHGWRRRFRSTCTEDQAGQDDDRENGNTFHAL